MIIQDGKLIAGTDSPEGSLVRLVLRRSDGTGAYHAIPAVSKGGKAVFDISGADYLYEGEYVYTQAGYYPGGAVLFETHGRLKLTRE